jgi:hypothetical protein
VGAWDNPKTWCLRRTTSYRTRQLISLRLRARKRHDASRSRVRFAPTSAKEIARIGRSEPGKLHEKALQAIDDCLGSRPKEIEAC